MNVKFLLFFVTTFIYLPTTFSQISITQSPQNYQLFPRNQANEATVNIGVMVGTTVIKKVSVIVKKETELWAYHSQNVPPNLPSAITYNFTTTIRALPAEYSFRVYIQFVNTTDSVMIMDKSHIVCGDILLLYGQSNMVASGGIDAVNAITDDKLLRNYDFGNGYDVNTLQWFPAKTPYARVGVIGLTIQRLILQQYNIPTAVINGSEGGLPIYALNNRNPYNHFDPNYYYGRFVLRALQAGAIGHVKAIVWRQGEAESNSWYFDVLNYPGNFTTLYNNLNEDLGGFDQLYNIQTGIYNYAFDGGGTIREFQRKTKYLYPKISTSTCMGIPTSDGVHHAGPGHEQIATELFGQIAIQFGSTDTLQIRPPDIRKVYKKPSNDTLVLVFDNNQKIQFPNDTIINGYFWSLKNYFYVNGSHYIVNNAWASDNRVFLKTTQAIDSGTLNYLPAVHNPEYAGTHLTNGRGLRAFSFQDFTIDNQLAIIPQISSVSQTGNNTIQITSTITPSVLPVGSLLVLERRKNQETTFTEIQSSNSLIFMDNISLANIDSVFYRIRVVSATSESAFSNIVRFTPSNCTPINLSGNASVSNAILSGSQIQSTQYILQNTQYHFATYTDLLPNFNTSSGVFFEAKQVNCY